MRLIPLRLKEYINQRAGWPVFDLTYYLQFQPSSLEHIPVRLTRAGEISEPGDRRRIALITPHLGSGGAENVLLEIASSLDRDRDEIFVIATHPGNGALASVWRRHADHVFDLATMAEPEKLPSSLYSILVNHAIDTVVLQNTLIGYSVLPHCRQALPRLQVIEVIHAVGTDWDIARATRSVAGAIDTRIVISEAARQHLVRLGTDESKIRLIRNGVDLDRFHPVAGQPDDVFRILFAARLDPVKRPLLLVDIALHLSRLQPAAKFLFVIAGDGPERRRIERQIRKARIDHLFELRGHVDDLAPVLAASDILLITSSNEGIPLTILEAFASARPVIASRVGAIAEVVDENTGMLIDRNADEAAAFARALIMLMEDPDLKRRMGNEARRKAEVHFDRRHSIQHYRDTLSPCR